MLTQTNRRIFIIAQFRITALDVSLLTRDSGTVKN